MTLLVTGLIGDVTLMQLGYLALLAVYTWIFNTSNEFAIQAFWMLTALYGAISLVLQYIFQFDGVRENWLENISDKGLADLGFVFQPSQLQLFLYLVSIKTLFFFSTHTHTHTHTQTHTRIEKKRTERPKLTIH